MFLKSIFQKATKHKAIDNSSFINIATIYNTSGNIIMLISLSYDNLDVAMEFIDACNKTRVLTRYESSEYSTQTEELILENKRYYILLSGDEFGYSNILNYANIGNSIVVALINEIYHNMDKHCFRTHIENGVLNENLFSFNIQRDAPAKIGGIECDDIDKISSLIPSCFKLYTILDFITCSTPVEIHTNLLKRCTALSIITAAFVLYDNESLDAIHGSCNELYRKICGTASDSVLRSLVGPSYMIDDDFSIPGSIDDESLDALFKQRYDRFNLTEDVVYESIDEVVSVVE